MNILLYNLSVIQPTVDTSFVLLNSPWFYVVVLFIFSLCIVFHLLNEDLLSSCPRSIPPLCPVLMFSIIDEYHHQNQSYSQNTTKWRTSYSVRCLSVRTLIARNNKSTGWKNNSMCCWCEFDYSQELRLLSWCILDVD